jgi:hypothetical protein
MYSHYLNQCIDWGCWARKDFTTGNYFSGHSFEGLSCFRWQYYLLFMDFISDKHPAICPEPVAHRKTQAASICLESLPEDKAI